MFAYQNFYICYISCQSKFSFARSINDVMSTGLNFFALSVLTSISHHLVSMNNIASFIMRIYICFELLDEFDVIY